MSDWLLVFLRAPRPGAVKSRLAATVGPDRALAIYRDLAERVLAAIPAGFEVELRYTPDSAGSEVTGWARPGWQLAPQGEGDLGARLQRAADDAWARGARRVLVIGTDSPEITGRDLHDARSALESHDVVLGPALDGGYWLIGLRQPLPGIFHGIPWSTAEVLATTVSAAQAAGRTVHRLRPLGDIDTEADWRDWQVRAGLKG
jgi:rSAM/selenodomain-associated transferase 1